MPGWNYADLWERIADVNGEAPAQLQGARRHTWRDFDQRADGIARHLLDAGAVEQDKVGQYLHNCPEYLESMFAAWKAGLVPFNTNYRYADDELVYLWDNADAIAIVFHGTFAPTIERVRDRVLRVRTWLWVDDGSGPCPSWATPYEEVAASRPGRTVAPWGRDGDHLYMLYTGGTTGMPKGVMWRQDDHIRNVIAMGVNPRYAEDPADPAVVDELVVGPGLVSIPACPLMHGTGCMSQLIALTGGGCVVTLESRGLDIEELFGVVEAQRASSIAIVGDAFARPMVAALDAEPDRWDLSSLVVVASSGVMFSEEMKQRLMGHLPGLLIVDAFSSSEAIGMGQSVSSSSGHGSTARFTLGKHTKVLDEDLREVEPGSGQIGRVAVGGHQPVGYYKDPEKTAATFVTVGEQRYSIPGDFATVEADGSITLLGRGSVCINTGGEKVFPEEVEEALKTHPAVRDAVAVGVPDERFGQAVAAVVELDDEIAASDDELIAHVKAHLAHYKAPRHVVHVATIGRAANGKVDYKRLSALAAAEVGASA
ncbi:MAG: acyl-CoA synthetase [Acidimicrobiales bacterium]|nr:acyl-CoA synthetase [Acidimicrobiales bacterium]